MSAFTTFAAAMFPLRTATFAEIAYADRPGATLGLYRPQGGRPPPLAVLFHGGGWTRGSGAKNVVLAAPLMLAGWAVANVRYRLAEEARAPAAVEDAIAALDRCFSIAGQYGLDATRIVPIGISAGAHLALCAGLAPEILGAPIVHPPVAAIVDLYGVADPASTLSGSEQQPFAREWFGDGPVAAALAERLSPVRLAATVGHLPPVFIAHGTGDTLVPSRQSEVLQKTLAQAGGDVELLLVAGTHGHFAPSDRLAIFAAVERFLTTRGLWPEDQDQGTSDPVVSA